MDFHLNTVNTSLIFDINIHNYCKLFFVKEGRLTVAQLDTITATEQSQQHNNF